VTAVTHFRELGHCRACRKVSDVVTNPGPGGTNWNRVAPPGGMPFMYDSILIWVPLFLSLALTYIGLYLAVRPLRHEHRRRLVVVLYFVFAALALMAAMYSGSKNA